MVRPSPPTSPLPDPSAGSPVPDVDSVDSVDSVEGLARLLRELKIRAGDPSLRELERLTRDRPTPLRRDTISQVCNGSRFPSKNFLVEFIRACGVTDPAEEARWIGAWERVALRREAQISVTHGQESSLVATPHDGEHESASRTAENKQHRGRKERVAAIVVQIQQLLTGDELAVLRALEQKISTISDGRLEVDHLVQIAEMRLPDASDNHVSSVLRSLIARGYLRISPSGRYEISPEGREVLMRRVR